MTTGDDGAGRQRRRRAPADDDQTFADLLNSFSFDGERRTRKARHEQPREPEPEPEPAETPPAHPDRLESTQPSSPAELFDEPPEPAAELPEGGDAAAIVRAYAWTGGRTRSNYAFAIETLVETSERGERSAAATRPEYRAVADLCRQPTSVAEVAALLSIPLGVAKVLLGDMADLGLIVVHQSATPDGYAPDMALMERVLSGLRRL